MKGWSWLFGAVLMLSGLGLIYVSVLVIVGDAWWSLKIQRALDVVVAGVVLNLVGLAFIVISKQS